MNVQPLTDDEKSQLAAWRAEALELMPYMATILLSLRPVSLPLLPASFACDDRYRLYINFKRTESMTNRLCAEALLHECFHLFAKDAQRSKEHGVESKADHYRYNVASDCANNDDLVEAGCIELGGYGMTPEKIGAPDNQMAEFYYEFLKGIERQEDESDDADANGQGSDSGDAQGSGSGSSGDSGDDSESDDGESESDESDDGEGEDESGGDSDGNADDDDQKSGSGSSGDADDDDDGEWAGCGSASGGPAAPGELDAGDDAGGLAPAASDTEIQISDISTAADILDYAAKHPGSVPGGAVQRAEQILKPSEVSWRRVLSSTVRRCFASRMGDFDTTYSRRNRRLPSVPYGEGRIIRPGFESPVPTLCVVRDTSMSMTNADLSTVSSEVEGIARQLGVRDENLIVIDVDVTIAAKRKYRRAGDLAEVSGRGGTDMAEGINQALTLRPAPSAVIVITDGYTPWPDEQSSTPVVACIVGEGALDSCVIDRIPAWIKAVKVPDASK